ncbi:MAG TPA: hypothetical protein VGM25_07595 [Caulobacteraceae bacterium]|jgi:hypothetical protein
MRRLLRGRLPPALLKDPAPAGRRPPNGRRPPARSCISSGGDFAEARSSPQARLLATHDEASIGRDYLVMSLIRASFAIVTPKINPILLDFDA